MKCNTKAQDLISLIYGEMKPEEAKKIRSHIEICSSCRKEFQELQDTSKLLHKWKDVDPNFNFVFVQESTSFWKTWKEKIFQHSWKRRLTIGVPILAAVTFTFIVGINFRTICPLKSNQKEQFAETLNQMQKETLILVSKMIEESEYRQIRDFKLTLTQFARELEKQRQQDLKIFGQGLEGLHLTTEGRFYQTNTVLKDLIRMTGNRIDE